MSRSPLTPALTRFFDGTPLLPVGFRRNGTPIWPIAGGAEDDDPQRPDDVPDADWDALGDPGKKALVRVRAKVTDLQQQLAAAKARPAPPKNPAAPAPTPPAPAAPAPTDTVPDVAKLVQEGIAAAMKPFQEAEERRTAEAAAHVIQQAVITAANERLHDGTDGLMIDMAQVVGDDGRPDAAKINAALDELVKAKPHLAKDTRRFAAPGVGPTPGGATPPLKDQVQSVLEQMQSATGIRPPKAS